MKSLTIDHSAGMGRLLAGLAGRTRAGLPRVPQHLHATADGTAALVGGNGEPLGSQALPVHGRAVEILQQDWQCHGITALAV